MRENCKLFKHFYLIVGFLGSFILSNSCLAEHISDCGRAPASFVPDDDMIIVPMTLENNFYDRFHERHKDEFQSAKKTLRRWIRQEDYAEAYGLENRAVFLPTPEQKQRFFEKRYMRFLSKDVEKSTNQNLQQTLEELTSDDEIDQIRAVELHEKVLIKAESNRGKKSLKKSKEVKVAGEKIKFGFQPRLEIGMAKFTLSTRVFKARAWLGINGNQEVYVERKFKSTNTRAFMNYYVDQTRILAAVDQKLSRHWSLRLTHNKDFDKADDWNRTGDVENNIFQLRFNMGF